jgi:hypothetical protein
MVWADKRFERDLQFPVQSHIAISDVRPRVLTSRKRNILKFPIFLTLEGYTRSKTYALVSKLEIT